MAQQENGFFVEEKRGVIRFVLKFTLRRQVLWTLLFFLFLAFIALGSTLSEEVRKAFLDILLSMLQVVLLRERHPN